LIPSPERPREELWDRALLAVLDGDFQRADDAAKEFDAALPLSADSYDHAVPARLRIHLLIEMDKMKDAAKVARLFLDKMAAWSGYPFAPDPSFDFYEPLYRAGEMSKRELTAMRADWLSRERERVSVGRTANDPWITWSNVYGGFAE